MAENNGKMHHLLIEREIAFDYSTLAQQRILQLNCNKGPFLSVQSTSCPVEV